MRRTLLLLILALITGSIFLAGASYQDFENMINNVEEGENPNIVLVTFESTRADHIGPCYGYERNTANEICDLKEDGILFENAFSPSSWTLPSLTAMRTSSYPNNHELSIQPGESNLSKEKITIAEMLEEEGYKTIGIGNAPFFHSEYNMDRGFDYFDSSNVNSRKQINLAMEKIGETEGPFYLWVHIFDPHQPYTPPEETRDTFAEDYESDVSADKIGREFASHNLSEENIEYIKSRYNEEILFADNSFGKLIDGLNEKGQFDDSLIVVSSDHGEDFTDQDPNLIGHGRHLYNVNTHIPLIMKLPDSQFSNSRVGQPVSLIDVFPTISEVVDSDKTGVKGQSLIKTYKTSERKGVVSQIRTSSTIIRDSFKYMEGQARVSLNSQGEDIVQNSSFEELYFLEEDFEEQNNLINNETDKANKLRNTLEERDLLSEEFY